MNTTLKTALGIVSALVIAAGAAHAAGTDAETVNCVNLNRIDHTQVVDNRTILFYMRDGTIYSNRLAHPVPGLESNRAFMYRAATSRLCNVDAVTVLENWGFGLTAGATGTLGKFTAIDETEADALLGREPLDIDEPVVRDVSPE